MNNALKKHIEDNFNHLKKMPVHEYLTYRKWEQLNMLNFTPADIIQIKKSLWYPNDPDDYLKIKPDLVFPDSPADIQTWVTLRNLTHSQVCNQNVGRTLRCFVIDRNSGKYLGVLELTSDFVVIGPRDNHIGWTTNNRRLFTAMAQPSGKLMALLTCCDKLVNKWNQKYNKQALIGITTTSRIGQLEHWHDCGDITGQVIEPSEYIYQAMKEWIKKMYKSEYDNLVSRPKITRFVLNKLGIKAPKNNAPRGVHFCLLYKDGLEFLRMEKEKIKAIPLFDNRIDSLFEFWKERYTKNNTNEHLFYGDMIGASWKDIKEKYIGR